MSSVRRFISLWYKNWWCDNIAGHFPTQTERDVQLRWETMETDKSGQTRVIAALLDLYQDSLGNTPVTLQMTFKWGSWGSSKGPGMCLYRFQFWTLMMLREDSQMLRAACLQGEERMWSSPWRVTTARSQSTSGWGSLMMKYWGYWTSSGLPRQTVILGPVWLQNPRLTVRRSDHLRDWENDKTWRYSIVGFYYSGVLWIVMA